ncbi:class I SAM-dependent methyltransferase [Ideonella sp.]|uniref:class I SAM-dependent methyltransferase n=1 Tax=Ideonella sp. TaxID=1929293 RepID=UPI0035B23DB7
MTAASSTFSAHHAEDYESMMGRWSRRLAPAFIDFAGIPPDARILDLGCGTGVLAEALSGAVPRARIVGVDLSGPYVEMARSRLGGAAEFRVDDACDLDLPDGSFDHVLSLLMLHFVPDPARAVAEMRRVCRAGGVVAAAVWDASGGYVVNRIFFDTAAMVDPDAEARRARNYARPMTRPGELEAAWHRAGLLDVQATQLLIRMEFSQFDDWWQPFLGREGPIAEYVGGLDDTTRRTLEAALRRAYLAGQPDGPRSYAAVAWAVRGRVPPVPAG